MPWKETDPMPERLQFLAAYLSHVYSMTALCERFGLRRNTGSTWVRHDPEQGLAGRPEQHGAHERLHRPLKAEATQPPEPHQSAQQHASLASAARPTQSARMQP